MDTRTDDFQDAVGFEASTTASDAFQTVDVDGDLVTLHSFQIRNADVAGYLTDLAEDERSLALTRAIEVGVFCLERASTSRNTDFVKREVDRLISNMETRVNAIPTTVRDELMTKVGTSDGQVLKPIVDATSRVTTTVNDRLFEIKRLYSDELDPAKDSSSLGKALLQVKNLLDPKRTDSVQGSLDAAIAAITKVDGVLAETVRKVVGEAVRPLKDEVDSLAREIRGQEAAEEALMQTIEKGTPYEQEVVEVLQPWAKAIGAFLEHVGEDNRPGDIVLTLAANSVAATDLRIVIEARDRATPKGRKAVSDDLKTKMSERRASGAIYLSRSPAGLGREIGDWCEGECQLGPWIATTHNHLQTAVRFLVTVHRLRSLRSESPQFDGSAIENQIQRIRTSMKRVTAIKQKVTTVRGTAEEIASEAELLREEVNEALRATEDAIRKVEHTSADCGQTPS